MFRWFKKLSIEEQFLDKFIEKTQWANNPHKDDSQIKAQLEKENSSLKMEVKALEDQNIALMEINEELRHEQQEFLISKQKASKLTGWIKHGRRIDT